MSCFIVLRCLLLQVKQSGMGHTNTMVFKQSMTYLEPLYERLRKRQLVEELKVGSAGGMAAGGSAVFGKKAEKNECWWVLVGRW
jgi:hypothetical protein